MAFVTDSFTDTSGTALTAHTGETGATWLLNSSFAGGACAIDGSGRLFNNGSYGSSVLGYASGTPAAADYDVQADFILLTTVAGEQVAVAGRASTSTATFYLARYRPDITAWEIMKKVSGTNTTLATSATQTLTAGTAYTCKLQLRGTALALFVNGTQVASATDSSITVAGRAGVFFFDSGVGSSSIGIHLDNFSAADPVTVPPVNTVAPAISGTAQSGLTVSCSTGTWTNTPSSYAYQWKLDGTVISGATASGYVIQPTDVGHALTCTVTATNAGGSVSATSGSVTPTAAPSPPVNTVAPAVTGTTVVGSVLSCTTGTWSNSPTGYTYQWTKDGSAITGATASTYTIATGDATHSLACTVTALNGGGSTAQGSNAITATAPSVPGNTTPPTISGTAQTGQPLTCSIGVWTNTPIGYAYQWNRAGSAITGATSNTYALQTADQGLAITCTVTASNVGGSAASTSNAITPVAAPAPGLTSVPVITGTAQAGQQVFCSRGAWTGNPSGYAYQWTSNTTPISGATTSAYTVLTGDVGNAISCVVTASSGSLSASASATPVVPVAASTTGSILFIAQLASSGLAGTCAMQVVDPATGNVLIARSSGGISEILSGGGIYVALRVTAPPAGALVIWDDGTPAAGHLSVSRY